MQLLYWPHYPAIKHDPDQDKRKYHLRQQRKQQLQNIVKNIAVYVNGGQLKRYFTYHLLIQSDITLQTDNIIFGVLLFFEMNKDSASLVSNGNAVHFTVTHHCLHKLRGNFFIDVP